MKFDITLIMEILMLLISIILAGCVIPIIKARFSEEKRDKLLFWVKTAVRAAEQMYGGKTGRKKKDYVIKFLLAKGVVFDVDEVTALLESEVYLLK